MRVMGPSAVAGFQFVLVMLARAVASLCFFLLVPAKFHSDVRCIAYSLAQAPTVVEDREAWRGYEFRVHS
jgi:hypothetical protein